MAVTIAPARTAEDFDAVAGLIDRMAEWDIALSLPYGYSADVIRTTYYSDDARALSEAFLRPGTGMFLARSNGQAIGCFGFGPLSGQTGVVQKLFVIEEARGQGAGRLLLAEVLSAMATAGYTRAYLDTATFMREAVALYRSANFQDCAPLRPALDGISLFMDRPL